MTPKLWISITILITLLLTACGRDDAEQAQALANRATVLWQEARYDEALPLIEQAVELRPEVTAYRMGWAMMLMETGETERAQSLYEDMLPDLKENAKDDESAVLDLIIVLKWLGRDAEAQAEFDAARDRYGKTQFSDALKSELFDKPSDFDRWALPSQSE